MSVTLGLRLAVALGLCLAATLGLRLWALIIVYMRCWSCRRARCHRGQLSCAMPAPVIRRKPDVKCAVGSTPRRRDQRTITFADVVEVFDHEVEGSMTPYDYDPSKLLRPETEPSEWLCGESG